MSEFDFAANTPKPPRQNPKRKTPNKKPAKYAPPRPEETKKPGNARTGIIIGRVFLIIVLLSVVGFGAYNSLLPRHELTIKEAVAGVKENLDLSDFPIDRGNGFVTAYVDAWLTITPTNANTRKTDLSKYGSDNTSSISGVQIDTVLSGPYISGARPSGDKTANYTVVAKTSTIGWVWLDVPVYYNKPTDSFAIITPPTLTTPPAKAKLPQFPLSKFGSPTSDDSGEFKPTVESFLKAWGSSDVNAIQTLSLPGYSDPNVYTGLQGTFTLDSVEKTTVYKPTAQDAIIDLSVKWVRKIDDKPVKEDAEDGKDKVVPVTIQSQYLLQLTKKGDKWLVLKFQPKRFFDPDTTTEQQPTTNSQGN